MTMSLMLMLAAPAGAQGTDTRHPYVPASGVAAEGGPGALWVNPANLGYDPDGRYGAYVTTGDGGEAQSVALTAGIGGLGFGLHNERRTLGTEVQSDWSVEYATSLALPQRLSIGLLLSWNFIENQQNYVAYDAGLSWRPLPWLGLAGVAQNAFNPDPTGVGHARSSLGIALRPLGEAVVLGADYARVFAATELDEDRGVGVATVRIRPTEGLFLRGNLDAAVPDTGELAVDGFGVGVEVYFGGVGAQYHAGVPDSDGVSTTRHSFSLGTDEPGESLFRSGRRVPRLKLSRAPAYEPRSTLLQLEPGPSWLEIVELLRRIEEDPGVRGLLLDLSGVSLSWARYAELRDRVEALEARDKKVVVYLRSGGGNGAYYVASAASRIAVHPASDVEVIGLSLEMMNLRGTLDLVGIEPQFVRRSEYKSGPESMSYTEPSAAAIEQNEVLLDDLFDEIVDGIAEGRDKTVDEVRAWIDGGPWTASAALEAGMVDATSYPDELDDLLEDLHDGGVETPDLTSAPQPHSPWEEPKQIAIVYVDGVIVSGNSSGGGLFGPKTAGSATVVRALDQARENDRVKAVVLRVDSPGGSSLASDDIWRAVERVKEEGKPLVVSMGGLAASGGYYVSAGADHIWAEPNTITGSIGVYSTKISASELFDNLGVHVTTLSRGRNANMMSATEPWDDVQRAKMQELIDEVYKQFKEKVRDGRGLTDDEVEEVARGRVWSGKRAVEHGLVDELGSLQDAIADARERAGIPPNRKVALISFSSGGGILDTLAPAMAVEAVQGMRTRAVERQLAPLAEVAQRLEPWQATMVFAMHPDVHTWLLDPMRPDVGPR